MSLPFTTDQFLDVLANFNGALWPIEVVLWLITAAVIVGVAVSPGPRTEGAAAAVLVLLWASGVTYHALFFTSINAAAWLFALLFLGQAALLAWYGVAGRLPFGTAPPTIRALGFAFAAYGLAYPAITLLLGHTYPRMPVFGVPCPTTLVTIGLLLTCGTCPAIVIVGPVLWALIGGSAAVLLGVPADYALFAGALALVAAAMPPPAPRRCAGRDGVSSV